jgi:ABC-type phosphate transport system permease subunit
MSEHRRRTPLSARGEPALWLTGSALVVSLVLIAGILGLILFRGAATFWPGPIERVELRTGEVFFGVPAGSEWYEPSGTEAERLAEVEAEGAQVPRNEDGQIERLRFQVGNRDLGQESFVWVPAFEVEGTSSPADAVLIERSQWGVFIGEPVAIVERSTVERDAGAVPEAGGGSVVPPVVVGYTDDGGTRVAVFETIAEGRGGIAGALGSARDRQDEIGRLNNVEIPRLQQRLDRLGWRLREAEMAFEAAQSGERDRVGVGLWLAGVAGLVGSIVLMRAGRGRRWRKLLIPVAGVLVLFVLLESPMAEPSMTSERLTEVRERTAERRAEVLAEQAEVLDEITRLREIDDRYRAVIIDPKTGRFAPVSKSEPGEPMRVSQIERMVEANALGFAERLGVYFGRWGDFLSQPPGEAPGTGGVFPVIVGTVILTLLLTVSVVPLGVVAALYLREYAKQGVATSLVRIAINNLAGVPSIVYGMFGLGFFCYTLGGYIDAGAGESALGRPAWWAGVVGVALVLMLGMAVWLLAPRAERDDRRGKWVGVVSGACWLGAVALAGWLIFTTPYFHGFFAEKLPTQQTFGGRGILWASLTLALLTLPVVIVATEEAIAAVPGSMREGSFGCGASRWQTIRRIVLPAAMPGIMTGAILAMARGAGEVAPLMLVGAVNLAPTLPVSGEAPYLHGDRTFMHLGFHIYNLGFQSPDAEATEPLVWTITLLLVAIVFALNLVAVLLRARLRRGTGSAV